MSPSEMIWRVSKAHAEPTSGWFVDRQIAGTDPWLEGLSHLATVGLWRFDSPLKAAGGYKIPGTNVNWYLV